MRPEIAARLRRLPKIDAILGRDDVRAMDAPRWAVVEAVRREVDAMRQRILSGHDVPGVDDASGDDGAVAALPLALAAIERRVTELLGPSLRRVINATGVILHTNLGRAPLAPQALERMVEIGRGYSNLEYDLEPGERGSRHDHLVPILTALTGAEDAAVVNNNAGAVMLCLAALAADREVIVSRGELIEIGGSFRIPDVMRLSGAHLVEVGTTNKTRPADVRAALSERTALLLKVHRSNFAMVGFTEEVSAADLAELGRESAVATMMDLGSGSFIDADELGLMGLAEEPSVIEALSAGVDLVTFSGDKLLGGPQAGILCGRRALVECARRHPLMRALRPDKLTMAALEATLTLYRDGRAMDVPMVAMLAAPAEELRARADRVLAALGPDLGHGVRAQLIACESMVGGGAMPLSRLPSWGLALWPHGSDHGVDALDDRLRRAATPVIGRIADARLILDMRTVAEGDLDELVQALRGLAIP
jgi:L-seryl-tRNA(Ser) seleniumtransferase